MILKKKGEDFMKKYVPFLAVAFLVVGTASGAAAARTGKQVYETICTACHGTGVSGAPKYGDRKWSELERKEGFNELVKDAIHGERAMPPRGGCTDCSDAEIKAAVRYMIDSAKKK